MIGNPQFRYRGSGQKPTLQCVCAMSALPPKADIAERDRHVRFVPKADKVQCSKMYRYSIISSASAERLGGTSMPSALAVLRLMTSSNLVDCTTGKSRGFSPFRILPA